MKSNFLKRFLITTLGSVIVSAAVYWFMVPYNLTIGGTAGLSIAVVKFFPGLPVGVFQLGINIILFLLAFSLIGAAIGLFGGGTIVYWVLQAAANKQGLYIGIDWNGAFPNPAIGTW